MKQSGWMVNLAMRRVEYVVAKNSHFNRHDYGLYQGPKRTYMLHDCAVFDTEYKAMNALMGRMVERFNGLAGQTRKYKTELDAVISATKKLENPK